MARRTTKLELNFDGLTDSVTNLVGALILLLLLIIGVTREAVSQVQPTRSSQEQESTPNAGEKSIVPLQQKVTLLNVQIAAVEGEISQLDARMEGIRNEVEELLKSVEQVQPPQKQPEPEPESPKEARQVKFRPPLEKIDVTRKPINFIVRNGRVGFMDFKALNETHRKFIEGKQGKVPVKYNIPGTDFMVTGTSTVRGGRETEYDLMVIRQRGTQGENASQIANPNSKFQRKLRNIDPQKSTVSFTVYPDSYEMFRKVRSLVWSRKIDSGWSPVPAGAPRKLSSSGSGGISVIQ